MMRIDPIVEEVRAAGEELVKLAGNDVKKFGRLLRRLEQKNKSRLLKPEELKVSPKVKGTITTIGRVSAHRRRKEA